MIWFTSDLHLYHANVIKYDNRPFKSVHEMNDTIINRINQRVTVDDTLVLCGDISFGNPKMWRKSMSRIKCKNVVLVQGNHDKRIPKELFTIITTRLHMQIAGQKVIVSHYPFKWPWWKRLFRRSLRFEDRRIPNDGSCFLIHGHIHGAAATDPHEAGPTDRAIHVGTMVNDYYPVSMKQIEKIINTRINKIRDRREKRAQEDEKIVLRAINNLRGNLFM